MQLGIFHQRITTGGAFRFGERLLYVGNALADLQIGLEEGGDGECAIYPHATLLATFRDLITSCRPDPGVIVFPCTCVTQVFPAFHYCGTTRPMIRPEAGDDACRSIST